MDIPQMPATARSIPSDEANQFIFMGLPKITLLTYLFSMTYNDVWAANPKVSVTAALDPYFGARV